MAVDLFANAANTTLAAGIAAGAVTLTVASSTPFPAVTTAAGTQFRVIIDAELFIVTNVTGLTWTVTPGAEGTTQAAHASGATVTALLTAGAVRGFALVADIVTVVAAAGAAQTLDAVGGTRTYDQTLSAASCAFTLTGAVAGRANVLTVLLRQDTTGGRLVTWPISVLWSGSVTPGLSAGASKSDLFSLVSVDGGTSWLGAVAGSGFTAPAVPSAPTGLAASNGSSSSTLTWTAVTGATPAVTTYNVYRGLATNPTTVLAGAVGNVTTYTDATAVNSTTYFYRVTAVNAVGESAYSNNASATPAAATGLPVLARTVTDGVTNTTATITSATAVFTAADVGKTINHANFPANSTIASVTNTTTAVMNASATASGTALTFVIGYVPAQWFKADALALADLAAVATWTDSSTGAKNATQATAGAQPVFRTAQVNALPIVRFTKASSQFLTSTYSYGPVTSQTMFVVVKETATGLNNSIVNANVNSSFELRYDATGTASLLKSGNLVYVTSAAAVPALTTAFSIIAATTIDNSTNTVAEITVNGALTTSSATASGATGAWAVTPLTIGQSSADGYFGGDLAEIIVYPARLTPTDRRAVEAYLSSKYGITVI